MDEGERPRRSDAPPDHAPEETLGPGERPQDTDPARRFAYEMAFDRRFEGLRWPEAEPELRAAYPAWTQRHGYASAGAPDWDRVKGRVRDAWEAALTVERTATDQRTGQWDERGAATVGWDERAGEYRGLWEARYGAAGGRWEEDEPGYRYAHEMAFDPRFQGRPWGDVEPGLMSGLATWAATSGYHITDHRALWDRLRDGIREAWERATHGGHRRPPDRA